MSHSKAWPGDQIWPTTLYIQHWSAHTVECRYNAVLYNTILHTSMRSLRHNVNDTLDPQNTPHISPSWWRHQIEKLSVLLAICAANSPIPGEFPAQRPVTRSFDVLFDLRLNQRLSKQSWGWRFETLSRPLWRHCNANGRTKGHILCWIW